MIDQRSMLTIFKDDAGIITDLSYELADFLNDTQTVTLEAADYLYIGFYKPFNAAYIELDTANVNSSAMTMEIWNGSAWVSVSGRDNTKGFSRNGFLTWQKSSMELSTIEGENKCWLRISVDSDTSAMVLKGINIVFSDKNTVKQEFYELDQLVTGDSFIAKLVASRNEIMDRLDQRGYLKYDSNLNATDLTPFDLHDVFQIRSAATYLTLAKIFFTLSDGMDDHWWAKYEVYQKKAMSALQLFKLDVDEDDDGLEDESLGQNKAKSIRWSR